eukprot:Lithocolla_globosa_v1_NODE_682_length_3441_cov_30.890068.p1 type:complete len:886 gc:universal NODE_682_length_3441_cov_30.890068:3024-367(-)
MAVCTKGHSLGLYSGANAACDKCCKSIQHGIYRCNRSSCENDFCEECYMKTFQKALNDGPVITKNVDKLYGLANLSPEEMVEFFSGLFELVDEAVESHSRNDFSLLGGVDCLVQIICSALALEPPKPQPGKHFDFTLYRCKKEFDPPLNQISKFPSQVITFCLQILYSITAVTNGLQALCSLAPEEFLLTVSSVASLSEDQKKLSLVLLSSNLSSPTEERIEAQVALLLKLNSGYDIMDAICFNKFTNTKTIVEHPSVRPVLDVLINRFLESNAADIWTIPLINFVSFTDTNDDYIRNQGVLEKLLENRVAYAPTWDFMPHKLQELLIASLATEEDYKKLKIDVKFYNFTLKLILPGKQEVETDPLKLAVQDFYFCGTPIVLSCFYKMASNDHFKAIISTHASLIEYFLKWIVKYYPSLSGVQRRTQMFKLLTQAAFDKKAKEIIGKQLDAIRANGLRIKNEVSILSLRQEMVKLEIKKSPENWTLLGDAADIETTLNANKALLHACGSLLFHWGQPKKTLPPKKEGGETQEKGRKEEENTKDDPKHRIMISYNWAHQKLVLRIVEELKKRGYSIWVDVEHMSGDTNAAMADAVEGSQVVLMCCSEAYSKSANCRLEAMYAKDKGKLIIPLKMESGDLSGWLGFLMAGKLWFPFWQEFPIEALHKELQMRLGSVVTPTNQLASSSNSSDSSNQQVTKVLVAGHPDQGRIAKLPKTCFSELHQAVQQLFKTKAQIQMFYTDESSQFRFQIVDDESAKQCGNTLYVNIPNEFDMVGVFGDVPVIFKMARLSKKSFQEWFNEVCLLYKEFKITKVIFESDGIYIEIFDDASMQRSVGHKIFVIVQRKPGEVACPSHRTTKPSFISINTTSKQSGVSPEFRNDVISKWS